MKLKLMFISILDLIVSVIFFLKHLFLYYSVYLDWLKYLVQSICCNVQMKTNVRAGLMELVKLSESLKVFPNRH